MHHLRTISAEHDTGPAELALIDQRAQRADFRVTYPVGLPVVVLNAAAGDLLKLHQPRYSERRCDPRAARDVRYELLVDRSIHRALIAPEQHRDLNDVEVGQLVVAGEYLGRLDAKCHRLDEVEEAIEFVGTKLAFLPHETVGCEELEVEVTPHITEDAVIHKAQLCPHVDGCTIDRRPAQEEASSCVTQLARIPARETVTRFEALSLVEHDKRPVDALQTIDDRSQCFIVKEQDTLATLGGLELLERPAQREISEVRGNQCSPGRLDIGEDCDDECIVWLHLLDDRPRDPRLARALLEKQSGALARHHELDTLALLRQESSVQWR